MTREETIKSSAKTIHRVEFPNSACWFGCNKCSYNGNCDYLKAAEIIYQQYIERSEIDMARKIFTDIDKTLDEFQHFYEQTFRPGLGVGIDKLKKKYKVED